MEWMETLCRRRSCRNYLPGQISEEALQTLLQATKLRLQAQDQHIVLISQKRDVLELKWQYPNLLPKANQLDISLRRRVRPVPGNPLMLRVSLANTPDILTLLSELLTTFSKLRKGNPLE